MTWSFTDSATPTTKDQVRILVDDTNSADPLVSDETIGLFLTGGTFAQANVYLSAARVAERIATRFARQVNSISSGDDSINYGSASDRAAFYRDLVDDLITAGSTGDSAPHPFLGGSSYADKAAREADTDRVTPSFTRARNEPYERSDLYGDWP